MSRKPESVLIGAVHREFKGDAGAPHYEKMHNPYRGGTADVWYSGMRGDLWVEFKWIPKLFDNVDVVVPDLSKLQLDWLISRKLEGRNVGVAVGYPSGLLYSDEITEWINGIPTTSQFTRREFSQLLKEVVGACQSSEEFLRRRSR